MLCLTEKRDSYEASLEVAGTVPIPKMKKDHEATRLIVIVLCLYRCCRIKDKKKIDLLGGDLKNKQGKKCRYGSIFLT